MYARRAFESPNQTACCSKRFRGRHICADDRPLLLKAWLPICDVGNEVIGAFPLYERIIAKRLDKCDQSQRAGCYEYVASGRNWRSFNERMRHCASERLSQAIRTTVTLPFEAY